MCRCLERSDVSECFQGGGGRSGVFDVPPAVLPEPQLNAVCALGGVLSGNP